MNRKTKGFCCLLFCCAQHLLFSQQQDSVVVATDKEVARITNIADWDELASFQIENFASKDAFLKLYYLEGVLLKMELIRSDIYSKRENTYYLKNEHLLFTSERSTEYATAITDEAYKASDNFIYETFSYFHQNALIYQVDNDFQGYTLSKTLLEALGASILDDFELLIALSKTDTYKK